MLSNPALIRIPDFNRQPLTAAPAATVAELAQWVRRHPRLLVLTGAGCSTASGIPSYRDQAGAWQRRDPILHQDFLRSKTIRRRYWARSFLGWPVMRQAQPNPTHQALFQLGQLGLVSQLITQNVDGLHQQAGDIDCINLHGTLSEVKCLNCDHRLARDLLQQQLQAINRDWQAEIMGINPDGDAELDERAYPGFMVADCPACRGVLMLDVVFFGGSVPQARVRQINQALTRCQAVLAIGTSLVVWSGYRIVRDGVAAGVPAAAVNNGRTRADNLLAFKLAGDCSVVLPALLSELV